jgi:hypothetical protein
VKSGFKVSPAAAAGERSHSATENSSGATMSTRPSVRLLATIFASLAWVTFVSAQQPGYPKAVALGTASVLIKSPPRGFLGLSLASEPESQHQRPIVCFGLRQVANEYNYTYFIIFKTDRTKKWELGCGLDGSGPVGLFDAGATLDKIQIRFGDGQIAKKVVISYKATWDEKTRALAKESLTIGGEEYKKDGPRVFLYDLTAEKPTCKPLKVALPSKAPKVDSDAETMSAGLIQSLRGVAKESPEVKEIFEGPPRK